MSSTEFERALADLGFAFDRDSRGVRHHLRRASRYLEYSVQVFDDGTALFSWEFAIGEFAADHGLQVGSDEHLNTFLFPRRDARGPQDPAWLASQLEGTEALLGSLSFLDDR